MKHLILYTIIISTCFCSYGQKAYLSNGKKTFPIENERCIGLTTKKDTIKYCGEGPYSYKVYKTTSDSLILRRPDVFQDTVVEYSAIYNRELGFRYIMVEYFKKNKVLYCEIRKILDYDYKKFHYSDLLTIQYYGPSRLDGEGASFIPFVDLIRRLISDIKSKKDLTKNWTIIIKD